MGYRIHWIENATMYENTDDRLQLCYSITAVISLVTMASYLITNRLLVIFNASFYLKLPKTKKEVILTIAPSSLHALLVIPMASYALYTDQELWSNVVSGKTTHAPLSCAITNGYMIGDSIYMVYKWRYLGNWSYLLHHMVTLAAYTYVIHTHQFAFFAMVRALAEISIPFTNLRLAVYEAGNTETKLYLFAGSMMMVTFFIARILPIPYQLYKIFQVYGTPVYNNSPLAGRILYWTATLTFDPLNIWWFSKMINGLIKVIYSDNNSKDHFSGKDIQAVEEAGEDKSKLV